MSANLDVFKKQFIIYQIHILSTSKADLEKYFTIYNLFCMSIVFTINFLKYNCYIWLL